MNNVLSVFDASAFVYAGEMTRNSTIKDLHYNMPIKGIVKLNTYVAQALANYEDVVVCFDSKSFRKEILTCYKEHRVSNREVRIQLDYLYKMYSRYGITCLKEDGLEADDLIYTVTEICKKNYKRVNIYGCDYDLTHNVDVNVNFLTMSSQVNSVDINSFETLMKTPFNTITLKKTIFGDASDNVPAFKGSVSNKQLFEIALGAYDYLKGKNMLRSPNDEKAFLFFLQYLKQNNTIPSGEIEELRNRGKVFYPKVGKLEGVKYISNRSNIDTIGLHKFLCETNSITASRYFDRTFRRDARVVEELKEWGNSYKSGDYFINNSIVSSCKKLDSSIINLKGL